MRKNKMYAVISAGMAAIMLLSGCNAGKKTEDNISTNVEESVIESSEVIENESSAVESLPVEESVVEEQIAPIDEKNIEEVAKYFLDAYQKGDRVAMDGYCDEYILNETGISENDTLAKDIMEKLGMSYGDNQVITNAIDVFADNLRRNLVKSYEITGMEQRSMGSVYVYATIEKSAGLKDLTDADLEGSVESLVNGFMGEHSADLGSMIADGMQEGEIKEYIFENIIPSFLQDAESKLSIAPTKKYDVTMEMFYRDNEGKWIIIDYKEVPAQEETNAK